MDVPLLLAQFLTISCHLQPDEVHTLWTCLPLDLRHRVRYRIERLGSRKPFGQASDAEVMMFLTVIDPRSLIEACEAAVQAGQVSREQVVPVQGKILAEMTSAGTWR